MTMQTAIETLVEDIKADYLNWQTRSGAMSEIRAQMVAEFNDSITVNAGRKYIKIVQNNSVWGFIVAGDGGKFPKGTILKAAGWAAPATNFGRGNVLEGGYTITWTGAN